MAIKLLSRKKLFRLSIAASFGVVSLTLVSSSNGPEPGFTGAPQESTCAGTAGSTNCHNTGSGTTLTIDFGAATIYLPGHAYIITITASNLTAQRFGFQMTSLKSNKTGSGSFVDYDTATWNTTLFGRSYVTHHSAPVNTSGTRTWTVKWISPFPSAGDITFYAAVNAANGDGDKTNDKIQAFSKVFKAAYGVGIEDTHVTADKFSVYPNPAIEMVNVAWCLEKTSEVNITIQDLSGKNSGTLFGGTQEAGQHGLTFNEDNKYPPGIYLLKINSGKKQSVQKLLIQ